MINHLWQSTLFAMLVWLLTIALRRKSARVRYWLWFAASMKFLLPLSLLVTVGSQFHFDWTATSISTAAWFEPVQAAVVSNTANDFVNVATAPDSSALMPQAALFIWLAGFAGTAIYRFVQLRRVRALIRQAATLHEGREIESLRRVQARLKTPPVTVVSSFSTLEPGTHGTIRPILALPTGISDRLSDRQLDTIIAHELIHIRHRDNLTATLHMLVETVVWFHPLVWWIGSRLIAERERACDEAVMRDEADPDEYAEAILTVCEFYMSSPSMNVAGISGSDLKTRIEDIMTGARTVRLGVAGTLLLTTTALVTFAVPLIYGAAHSGQSPNLKFEVAIIKPSTAGGNSTTWGCRGTDRGDTSAPIGRCIARNAPLKFIIGLAYRIPFAQMNQLISGGPDWLANDRYDIDAKSEPPATEAELFLMLQTLLADQLKLKLHTEEKEMPAFALTLAGNGKKLHESAAGDNGSIRNGPGRITGQKISISDLARWLSGHVGRVVVDKTGLTGNYDFEVTWEADSAEQKKLANNEIDKTAPAMDTGDSSLFTALVEQLGLRLVPEKSQSQTRLIIESAEKPHH